jgi:maltoporin
MRSNRLRGCLVVAALFAGTSSASARDNTNEKTDETAAETNDDKVAPDTAAPERVAQANDPTQPASQEKQAPTAPAPAPVMTDEMRKMIADEVAKGLKPRQGISLEFNGYARAGVGLNARGGSPVCFGLAGADTKWRLGNECDYVIEPQFTGRIVTGEDKSSWGVVVMPGLYRTWQDITGGQTGGLFSNIPTEFRQIYFFGENVPQLLNGRIWGGRRYYDRLHLDINDQFLEIEDGDGAGIEEMHVGPGKLSLAFLMNPNSEANQVPNPAVTGGTLGTANIARFRLNARFTDIPTVPEGALQIWTAYDAASTSADQRDPGVVINKPDGFFRFALYHTLAKVLGGTNLIGLKTEQGSNHQLYRATVQEEMFFNGGHTEFDVIAEFRSQRNRPNSNTDYATDNWFSLGARGDTQIQGPFRFLVEAGIDHVAPDTGPSPDLFKATACLAVNAGPDSGSRPTFRLFYTHAFWNDAAKISPAGVFAAGQSGTRLAQVYGNASNGGTFGLQAEAWW